MDAELWKRVDDLLQSALATPADQQEEFLRQACADDPALLHEVRSLLTAHRKSGNFLEPPSINSADTAARIPIAGPPSALGPIPGQVVSHYRVLGELGSGGMGIVYEAEDIKLGRRVAMKFLPGEVTSDRVAFERLQREARAASALDHSNICPVHELGEYEGQPFIVMQLLEGQTLRDWIGDISKGGDPSRFTQTLDLAVQIAKGLEAAHQKGIIHRDIKPANVFVTRRGDAKILDFGLAKMLEDYVTPQLTSETIVADAAEFSPARPNLHLTRTGTTMGTAYYMSPEQVRGEKLDWRTDLFSLGLVLYEMVTGQKAFAGDTGPAVYDAILHRVPVPVRQLNQSAPAELERIINKAIAKDRRERYQSSQEIVKDLEALRNNAGASRLGRRRKWIAIPAVLAVIAVGLGVLLERSRQPGLGQPGSPVKVRKSVAVLGFRNLSNRAGDEWISTALAEMMSTELATGQQLRIIPGENVAHMKLDLALSGSGGYGLDTLRKIRSNLETDVIVQGSYLVSAGGSLRVDLQLQEAGAGEMIATVSENGSEAQIADLVSRAGATLRGRLGIAAMPAGDLDKARSALPADPQAARLYSEGLAKLRTFDALAARNLLSKAVVADPNHALSHFFLADSLFALGYEAQAQTEGKKAVDLSHDLPRESQLLIEGRYRELSNDYSAAIEAYRSLWKFFPDDLDYGLRLAAAQTSSSRGKDALLTVAQLRTLQEPSRNDPRVDLAEASASESQGDFKRSEQAATAAAEKATLQGSRLLLVQAKQSEGWAWDRLGELDKGFAAYSESRELAQSGGNLRAVAKAFNGMANTLYDKGDLEGARKYYQDALRIGREIGAQKTISAVTANIGNVYFDQGKLAEARRYYQQALEINQRIDNKRGIASDSGNLANVLQGMGDLSGSIHMQEQTVQAFRDVGDRRGEAMTLSNLGSVLTDQGQLEEAQRKFEEASKIIQQIGFQRGRVSSMLGIATLLEAHDKLPESRAAALEALTLSRNLKDDSGAGQSQWQLARIVLEQGDASEAEKLAREAALEFDREKSVANGCSANALLSRALVIMARLKEARSASDLALTLCQQGQDRGARFQAELASADVASIAGESARALRILETANAESRRDGYAGYELESRLLMGKIELSSGRITSGQSRLEALLKDAQHRNFNLIAREAQTALSPHR
jgi:eukaryotic-like serine/threonine-protein kinase